MHSVKVLVTAVAAMTPDAMATVVTGTAPYVQANGTTTVYQNPTSVVPPYTLKNVTSIVHPTGAPGSVTTQTSTAAPFPMHNSTNTNTGTAFSTGTAVTSSVGPPAFTSQSIKTHGSTFTPGRHANVKTSVVTSEGSVVTVSSTLPPFPLHNSTAIAASGSFTGLTGSSFATGTAVTGSVRSTVVSTATVQKGNTITVQKYCPTCPPVAPGLPATNTTLTVESVCPTCPVQTVASTVTGVSTALTVTHVCPTCPPVVIVPTSTTSIPAFATTYCPVCPVNKAIASAASASLVVVATPNAENSAAASRASVIAASAAQSAASEADNTASAASAIAEQASATAVAAASSASAASSVAAATPNPSNEASASAAESTASSLSQVANTASSSAVEAESSAAAASAAASSAGAPLATPAETTPASSPSEVLSEAPAPTGTVSSEKPVGFTGAAATGYKVSGSILALALAVCFLL